MAGERFIPSVELIAQAQKYLGFLRTIARHGEALHQKHVVQNAVRRYEVVWLPLAAAHADEDLAPPVDVHWVWHVHLLCPRMYEQDCERLLSSVPRHRLYSDPRDVTAAKQTTRAFWYTSNSAEPFDINDYTKICPDVAEAYTPQCHYDILAAARRQKDFYHNVSLPHYDIEEFLMASLMRYKKFVRLKKLNPTVFLVPMYDIDVIWHAHQLCPTAYRRDTTSYLGFILPHEDSVGSERGQGSRLEKGYQATRALWESEYTEPYAIPGVQARYDANNIKTLHTPLTQELRSTFTRVCYVRCDSVTLEADLKSKVRLAGSLSLVDVRGVEACPLQVRKGAPFEWKSGDGGGLLTFELDSRHPRKLKLKIDRCDGLKGMLFGKNYFRGLLEVSHDDIRLPCDLLRRQQSSTSSSTSVTAEDDACTFHLCTVTEACTVRISFTALRMRYQEGEFRVEKRVFAPHSMTGDAAMCRALGDDDHDNVVSGREYPVIAASHRVLSGAGHPVFTLRVLHSTALQVSALQLLHDDQMVVISRLIGADNLPAPSQVSEVPTCPCLDGRGGERAMIILNHKGEWGVLRAAWTDYHKGAPPPKPGETGRRGDPGYLTLTFYDLVEDRVEHTTVFNPYGAKAGRNKTFTLKQVSVDLVRGTLTLAGECKSVAEHVTLALAAALLCVLCEPRQAPPGIVPLESGPQPPRDIVRKRGNVAVQLLNVGALYLLQAAGYHEVTPSNGWLFWRWHLQQHGAAKQDSSDDEPSYSLRRNSSISVPEGINFDVGPPSRQSSTATSLSVSTLELPGRRRRSFCDGLRHGAAPYCPWNPRWILQEAPDPAGCGGCGGCAASGMAAGSGSDSGSDDGSDNDDDDDDDEE